MSEWISVKERAPEEGDQDYNGEVWVYDLALGVTLDFASSVAAISDYTHWMPTGLTEPKPPKEPSHD